MKKIWTKNKCFEMAKYCKTRTEFEKTYPSAYQSARRHKWLDEMNCFERKKNPFINKMDNVYIYKFIELNAVYIGRTIYPSRRDWEHRNKRSGVFNFSKKHGIEIPEMHKLDVLCIFYC